MIEECLLHNFCKKLAQLDKVIQGYCANLEERKMQSKQLKNWMDKTITKINQEYIEKITKIQQEYDKLASTNTDTSKNKYEEQANKMFQSFKNETKSITDHTNNRLKDIEVSVDNLRKVLPSIIQNFSAESDIFTNKVNNFNQDLNKAIEKSNKDHELALKKVEQDFAAKSENDERESRKRIMQMENSFKNEQQRPQTALGDTRTPAIIRQLKKDISEHKKLVLQMSQKVKNMQVIAESNINSYRDKFKGLASEIKFISQSNEKALENVQKELDSADTVLGAQKQGVIAKLEAEIKEITSFIEKLQKELEENKIAHQKMQEEMKTRLSETSESSQTSFKEIIERQKQEIEIRRGEISKVQKEADAKYRKASEEFNNKKIELDEELHKFNVENLKTYDETEEHDLIVQHSEEIEQEILNYQSKSSAISSKFDQIKITNSQIPEAAKKLAKMQEELLNLQNSYNDQIRQFEIAAKKELNDLQKQFEQEREELANKLSEEEKELSKEHEGSISMLQDSFDEEIQSFINELSAPGEVEQIPLASSRSSSRFNLEIEEFNHLNSELDALQMPPGYQSSISEDSELEELHNQKKYIKEKINSEKAILVKEFENEFEIENQSHLDKLVKLKNTKDITQKSEKLKLRWNKVFTDLEIEIKKLQSTLKSVKKGYFKKSDSTGDSEIDEWQHKLFEAREESERIVKDKQNEVNLDINLMLDEIQTAKKANYAANVEADNQWEEIHKVIKEKFTVELDKRSKMRADAEEAINTLTRRLSDRFERRKNDLNNQIEKIKAKLQSEKALHVDDSIQVDQNVQRRRDSLNTRNERLAHGWANEIEELKGRREKLINEISQIVMVSNAKIDAYKNEVKTRPPRPEEQKIIDNLQARLDEINKELILVGRVMLNYRDCLLLKNEQYNARFARTEPVAMRNSIMVLPPLPPVNDVC